MSALCRGEGQAPTVTMGPMTQRSMPRSSRVRSAVEFILGPSQPNGTNAYEPTPRLLSVIELAGDEAQRLRQREIGSEHLLLGLLREGAGVAVFILDTLGVNLEKARMRLLGASEPGA